MKLIADSGSTKSDWCITDGTSKPRFFETKGFNPYYTSSSVIRNILEKELLPVLNEKSIKEVFYYGSGCSTDSKKIIVDNALSEVFPGTHIEVEHDLLGAARGLLKHEEGIVCILGTGSNSCFYDGKIILENIPSLGYVYGDEGSGAHIGKKLLMAYLKNKLPAKISQAFSQTFNLTLEQILDETYRHERPNKFMASFAGFITEHIENEFMLNMVKTSFEEFFTNQIFHYTNYAEKEISFTGSIAFIFRDILESVMKEYNLKQGSLHQKPIEGLAEFHRTKPDSGHETI